MARLKFCRACLFLGIFFMAAPLSAEWGNKSDKVKKTTLGRFWGKSLNLELRTRPATIRSSHVRVQVFWHNKAAKKDESQTLFDDERKAQFDEYGFKYDRFSQAIFISYKCPKNRKDKDTTCKERWLYHQAKNKWVLKETTSTNPAAESRKKILEMIQKGKLKKAQSAIKLLKKNAKQPIETDDFFAAYFLRMHQVAYAQYKAGQFDKAAKTLEKFRQKPPVVSSQSCPSKEKLFICLKGKDECGCNEAFGMLPANARYAKRVAQVAKIWAKKKKNKRIIATLAPMMSLVPDQSALHLLLADAYWDIDFKTKARAHYKLVRQLRQAERGFMPSRVEARYKTP